MLIFLMSCGSTEHANKENDVVALDSSNSDTETVDTVVTGKFIDFPIPVLDSIFPYFETSGAVTTSPSSTFYNPTDSGIFVSYALFDKAKMNNPNYSFAEKGIGSLITHTYRKPKYGWSEQDKDQTFILLRLHGGPISIGSSIQIGTTLEEVSKELGDPIYHTDSSFVFLGKNKFIGKLKITNGHVESLTYGRFNLADSIFTVDHESLKSMVEDKLEEINK